MFSSSGPCGPTKTTNTGLLDNGALCGAYDRGRRGWTAQKCVGPTRLGPPCLSPATVRGRSVRSSQRNISGAREASTMVACGV